MQRAAPLRIASSGGRTFYVSGQGNDRRNGLSIQSAFRSLQRAADLTRPGDRVYVLNGTYRNPNPSENILTIRRSGTPQAWITYQAYPGQHPRLQAQNWNAISVEGASYITIKGLRLVGNADQITLEQALQEQGNLANPLTSGNGIGVTTWHLDSQTLHPHHIQIRNNQVSGFSGGGIFAVNADYITIENNTVAGNAFYSPYANSGISLYQSWNSDGAAGYKMRIRNNVVYGNQNLVPFYALGQISDGNGIIVDDGHNTQLDSNLGHYQGRTLIENNIVYQNGGRGIHVFESDAVDILNNTTYHNSQHPQIADGEITVNSGNDVQVFNNILVSQSGRPANTVSQATNVIYSHNLIFNAAQFTGAADQNRFGNPRLINPQQGDFRLRPGSPAIDAGDPQFNVTRDRLGRARPVGKADLGAIEFVAVQPKRARKT
jgi:parallel beta-helix repeat protein